MEMMVATKVVDFSSQSILEKLKRMLVEEVALLAGVEDDVRYIVDELRSITSFLTVMSTRRNLNDQMQNWVQEVRGVAYDAEDSIDEFRCFVQSTPYDEHGIKSIFMRFCRCLKSLKARHGIASELKKLKVEVREIRKRHDRYSHTNEATSPGEATRSDMADSNSDPRIISHFVEEAQLVGINKSKDELIGWVMDKNFLNLTVISIFGSGGLGKTTLAKSVYDACIIVRSHFQYRAWIIVSQNYSIKELLKKIIRQISVEEQQIRDVVGCLDTRLNTEQLLNMMDDSQLVQTVRGHLSGKRYLVAFDDVWSTEAWARLNTALPQDKEGSRVIVTTRNEDVANACCSRNHQFKFKVSPLSPELSWELFCRKVFDSPDYYSCPSELEKVGREIVQKCNGLPLALVTVGGLLASKPEKELEEWKYLHDHLPLELQINETLSKINQILILSYNDLPYYLKSCFLFLGIFPGNYEIRRKHLIRRWIAEGIVSCIDGFPAEIVAEHCFNQLVSRSLVQPSEFNDNGTVKSCRVHELMLEVIISISRKENFEVLLNEHPPRDKKIRRLSWHGGGSKLMPDTLPPHLRSFTASGKDVPLKDYRKQRLLRVIDLEGCWNLLDLHQKSFSKLFLLKYLSLRDSPVSALPDSVGDLQNLEFLDVRETFIAELPNTIVKLQNLIYLLAGGFFKKYYPMGFRMAFDMLKVPKGIKKLKKLGAFGMAHADNVQLLQEMGELVNLKKLAVNFGFLNLSHIMLEEIKALLTKLNSNLRSLTILHFQKGNLKMALDEVASPPLLLCKLQIHADLGRLPAWFASLEKVVKITLSHTYLRPQDLQVLRNLNTLVKLVLRFDSFIDYFEDLVFHPGGFVNLKFLTQSSLLLL